MQCPNKCNSKPYVHGSYGKQSTPRYKCPRCGKTFSLRTDKPSTDFNIPTDTLYRILACLTEGCGVRATARLNNVHAETVLKVLRIAGKKAETILDRELRNVRATQVQIDELWGFVAKKAKRIKPTDSYEVGDAWTFVAVTEDKLVPYYLLGKRDPETAYNFISQLRERIPNRFQLSADGWGTYEPIIEDIFGSEIDYGQAIKDFGPTESSRERYSPSDMIGVTRKPISGNPTQELISTSIIERNNLTIRTKMRRLTRLASGFSKKRSYLAAALALHFFCYNFVTVHSSIRCTPAQQARITDRIWKWSDLFNYSHG